jgi:hypothetical protein
MVVVRLLRSSRPRMRTARKATLVDPGQ